MHITRPSRPIVYSWLMSQEPPDSAGAELRRRLPQVEAVLGAEELAMALQTYERSIVLRLVRMEIAVRRRDAKSEQDHSAAAVAAAVVTRLSQLEHGHLRRVVNGTCALV